MHRDVWLATHVRREQTVELLDRRMLYLQQCRQELEALLDLFEKADESIIYNAVDSVLGLSAIADCADAEALRSGVPLPTEPDKRLRLAELRESLARIAAMRGADRLAEASELAYTAVETSIAIGYAPTEAVAFALLGDLQRRIGDLEESEESLFRAVCAAERAHADREKAKALVDLVYVVGYQQKRSTEGKRWANLANAALLRAGDDPVLRARLVNNTGSIYWSVGEYDRALSLNTVALNIRRRVLGRSHPAVADSLNNLGGVYLRQGRGQDAIDHFEKARQIFVRTLGEAHPNVAVSLLNIAGALSSDGRYEEAVEHSERAVEIVTKRFGPDHPRTGSALRKLGTTYLAKRAPDLAVVPLHRALEIAEQRRNSRRLNQLKFLLARALWESDEDRPQALALAQSARTAWEESGDESALVSVNRWLDRVVRSG